MQAKDGSSYCQRAKCALKTFWNEKTSSTYLKDGWKQYDSVEKKEHSMSVEEKTKLVSISAFICLRAFYIDCVKERKEILPIPRGYHPFKNWMVPNASSWPPQELHKGLITAYLEHRGNFFLNTIDPKLPIEAFDATNSQGYALEETFEEAMQSLLPSDAENESDEDENEDADKNEDVDQNKNEND